MVSPYAILVAAAIFSVYYGVMETVKGVEALAHKTSHAVVKVVHKLEHPKVK